MIASISQDVDEAISLLQQGELVAIPTETVYGLAANGLDATAVAKIFAAKARPSFDPLILHTSHADRLSDFVLDVPAPLRLLAEQYWPGPLTIVVEKQSIVPDITTSGLPTVAVRVPAHPLALSVLERLDFPLAAPSANPFGYVSPTTARHVADQLGDQISMILDGGPSTVGLESTIVSWQEDKVHIVRKGGLPVETIESIVGPVILADHSSSNPLAPGMLASHYATRTRIVLSTSIDSVLERHPPDRVGVLRFSAYEPTVPTAHQIVLSRSADLTEAASRLFAAMRSLDALDIDVIVAELVPDRGLGRAINDKLRRASAL